MLLIVFIDLIGYCCHDESSGSVFSPDILRFFIINKLPGLESDQGAPFSVV